VKVSFLVTNDDGVEAPGLRALAQALAELGEPWILAPDSHRSGCSHAATTDRHLELKELAPRRHALDGTPVDCTRVGLLHLAPHCQWVMSGINEGGNLGADVYLSGTVAAVREACLWGVPGIAVSQYRKRGTGQDWERAALWTRGVVEQLLKKPCPPGMFWNVNLPDLPPDSPMPEIVECDLDPHPLPVGFAVEGGRLRYHGDYHGRQRRERHDVDVCFSGQIAVTLLRL